MRPPMSTQSKRVWWTAAVLAALLAGCGGGGGDNDPDLLLGSWRKLDPVSRAVQAQLTFDPGGRVSVQAEGASSASAGLFEADDAHLVIESTDASDGMRYRDRYPYKVSKDRLIMRVLEPTGSHDGIVGTFKGAFSSTVLGPTGSWDKAFSVTWAITFRADDTVRLVETPVGTGTPSGGSNGSGDDAPGGAPVALEGTYQTIGPNAYQTSFATSTETLTLNFSLADGVIGDLYVR